METEGAQRVLIDTNVLIFSFKSPSDKGDTEKAAMGGQQCPPFFVSVKFVLKSFLNFHDRLRTKKLNEAEKYFENAFETSSEKHGRGGRSLPSFLFHFSAGVSFSLHKMKRKI